MKKINLEEIISKVADIYVEDKDGYRIFNIEDVKNITKEFGKQLLELAAENAKTTVISEIEVIVNKKSITNTINQVE